MDKDFDYEKELETFCKERDIWDEEKECPTRFVINKLKTITVTHPDGYTYLQNIHDGFTTKRIKLTNCHYCHEKLTGQKRMYCSPRCRDLGGKIRKKLYELMKYSAEGIWITKDPYGFPQWKNMKVTYRGKNGEYIEKPLTSKSSKPRNNNLKEFSTGKDY